MGKKILGVIAFAAIAAAAGWNYQQNTKQNTNEVGLSDLALANIDALARWEYPNEGSGMKKQTCYNGNGVATGARCVTSTSHSDVCHYQNDQWGNCN